MLKKLTKKRGWLIKDLGVGERKLLVNAGKRKIVIILSGKVRRHILTEAMIYRIVLLAKKRGWKTIILQPDDGLGETIEAVNTHQFYYNHRSGKSGVYIGSPIEWETYRSY